jgi:hypothetical protein
MFKNTQVHPLKELHIVCLFVNDELILPSTIEAAKINRQAELLLALRDVLASFRVSLIKEMLENLEEDANLG